MTLEAITNAFVTLLVIVEPVALVPLFLGLTAGFSGHERRQVATRGALIAFCILAVSAVAGDWLLSKLGISLPAFRIAGGLLLFWIGYEMVFSKRAERKAAAVDGAVNKDQIHDIAAFPVGIPLLAGPGAITATILVAGQNGRDPVSLLIVIGIIGVVMALSWLCLFIAERVDGLLGKTGNAVLSRVLGIILTALAVQFVADGLKAIIRL